MLLRNHGNVMESPEVVAAIEDCHAINQEVSSNGLARKWAKLFVFHGPKYRRVTVDIGTGTTIATHSIDYILCKDGSVYKSYAAKL